MFSWKVSGFRGCSVSRESGVGSDGNGKINFKKLKMPDVNLALFFVIRIGLKPMTCCLEGSCSIQLSYRTILLKSGKDNFF